jgi:hypothetical protein
MIVLLIAQVMNAHVVQVIARIATMKVVVVITVQVKIVQMVQMGEIRLFFTMTWRNRR